MAFYDSIRDPIDNSIIDLYHWKSSASTGTSTNANFNNLVIPSSPNFPNSTSTRYMLKLPGEIYYAGIAAGTFPFLCKDITTSTILTRVAPSGTLTANTFKVFQDTAESPHYLEIHVGSSSCQAGDSISFDGYFLNSILCSTFLNDIVTDTITCGSISASGDINTEGGVTAIGSMKAEQGFTMAWESGGTSTEKGILEIWYELTNWDMTASAQNSFQLTNLPNFDDILDYGVTLRNDANTKKYKLPWFSTIVNYFSSDIAGSTFSTSIGFNELWARIDSFDGTFITLSRSSNSTFNSTNFNSTLVRGWAYVKYIAPT